MFGSNKVTKGYDKGRKYQLLYSIDDGFEHDLTNIDVDIELMKELSIHV